MVVTFFTGKLEQFFRPLTHADRESCAAVRRSLYDRVQGPNADYSEALSRELALADCFPGARRSVAAVGRVEVRARRRGRRATGLCGRLLRKLKEHGWIEDHKHPIDPQANVEDDTRRQGSLRSPVQSRQLARPHAEAQREVREEGACRVRD
jgi:hypothetical protein